MNNYTSYEYLSFVLPGGLVLLAIFYGYYGWPWGEPGATALVGILAACFVVGHAVSGVAQFLQPLLWGQHPSNAADSGWGLFGRHSPLVAENSEIVRSALIASYETSDFQSAFARCLTEIRADKNDEFVNVLNSQIGFYRNMTFAAIAAALVVAYYGATGRDHLPLVPWLPAFGLLVTVFANRYRHFWTRFGAHVVNYGRRRQGPTSKS